MTRDDDKQPQISVEEAFDKLEELCSKLESRETSLEESFILYQEGVKLIRSAGDMLDTVEKKMMQLNEDGSLVEFRRPI